MDLIVYDGVCVLCSRGMQFIARRDSARFHFVPLQSPYGQALAKRYGISTTEPETFVAIIGGAASFRSDAILAILSHLPGWRWTCVLHVIPKSWRDRIYDFIARGRYRWFGRYDHCPVPPPDLAHRVIQTVPANSR
jgi:predicted DCC family thiol-disulfide oxidoreductase YuxK